MQRGTEVHQRVRQDDTSSAMHLSGEETVVQPIVKINRTISIWPAIWSGLLVVVSIVFQATLLYRSNDEMQRKVTEMTIEIKRLTDASNQAVRENDKLGYRIDSVGNRVDGLENRVNTLERTTVRAR